MTSRRVMRVAFETFLTIGALLGVLCLVLTVAGAAFQVKPLLFRSGSMSPAIHTGDLAIARKVDAATLQPGDVVSVVTQSGARVTHRLVESVSQGNRQQLTLQGDANDAPDAEPYVTARADKVLFRVPKVGYLVNAAASPFGMFVGGLYVAALLALIFRRRPPGGDGMPPPAGHHRSQHGVPGPERSPAALRTAVAVAAAASLTIASPAVSAPWTESAPVTSINLTAYSVVKPAAVNCTVDNPLIGTKSLTTTWQASSTPVALTYTAVARESGTNLTITTSGTNRSVTVTGSLLGTLLGDTFHIDVTATVPGTNWSAVSTRTGTLALLGLGFTCGAWS